MQNAIRQEPLMHSVEISVNVHNGLVILTGSVDSYTKKEAEIAAKI